MSYHTKIHILNLENGMCDNRIHMAYKYPLNTFHKTNFSSFMQNRTVWNWLQFVYTIVGPYEKTLSAHFFKYSFLNRWGYNRWLCQCNTILEIFRSHSISSACLISKFSNSQTHSCIDIEWGKIWMKRLKSNKSLIWQWNLYPKVYSWKPYCKWTQCTILQYLLTSI